jgi:hypothetical protein
VTAATITRPLLGRVAAHERPWLGTALATTAAGLVAAAILAVQNGLVLGFLDAPTHVLIPSRVFHNSEATLAQLGTHWGPLFHVLQLPFSWLDPLVRTGASGMVVSAGSALVTSFFLYRLARLLEVAPGIALACVALLVASPSFLYAGVVPMLYTTITAAITANVYFLTRWALTGSGLALLLAGLSLSAATLAHFETWVLLPIELGVVLIGTHRRWRSAERTRATAALWLLASSYGVLVFGVMNVAIYGDPFAFLTSFTDIQYGGIGPGEAASIAQPDAAGSLVSLANYPLAAWTMAGPALSIAGLAGVAAYVWRFRGRPAALVPLLLLYPFAWYALQAPTVGDWIHPAGELEEWTNLRYATTILPAAAFFAAAGLRRPLLVGLVLAVVALLGARSVVDGQVATWVEARANAASQPGVEEGADWLAARAEGQRVLAPVHATPLDRLELESGLGDGAWLDLTDAELWRGAIESPRRARELEVGFVVWIGNRGEGRIRDVTAGLSAALCFDDGRIEPFERVRIYAVDGRCAEPGGAGP